LGYYFWCLKYKSSILFILFVHHILIQFIIKLSAYLRRSKHYGTQF